MIWDWKVTSVLLTGPAYFEGLLMNSAFSSTLQKAYVFPL